MYKLTFYVPDSHVEQVKAAVFAAGAGRMGDYEHCCWQVLGQGQFKPMQGAQPFLGQVDQLETLDEWRVEMVVDDRALSTVIAAFKQVHPY
ncbi:MAG: hypothetical protein RL180_1499, partial [Pseudomonadota bacterium]